MPGSTRLWALAAAFSLTPLALPMLALAQTIGEPMRFTAWAVNMSNIGTGGNSTVIIQIDRWSSEAERQNLRKVFFEKGPDKLLDALQDTKRVGFMRLPNSIGYDLRAARLDPMEDGGQRVLILTDRRIGFREAASQPRTIDYPFTLIEIRLNKDGEGEGRMSVATKITFNEKKNTLELENYSSEPVRLQNVRMEQIRKK
jgi:hypothetical protein